MPSKSRPPRKKRSAPQAKPVASECASTEKLRSAITGQTLTKEWLSYVAGYLDGEGCFVYINSPTIQVASVFPYTLRLFAESFGGNVKKRMPKDGLRKVYYDWRTFGDTSIDVINLTLPYLHEKKQQAELILLMRKAKKGPERDGMGAQLVAMKKIEYE